jgi:hypothetical protein
MHVHEFMSLDGVIDAPTWTVDYEFLPEMEKTLGAVTGLCRGILLGRTTYEMFEPACSNRTVEDDPGALVRAMLGDGQLSLEACEHYKHGVVYLNYRPQA